MSAEVEFEPQAWEAEAACLGMDPEMFFPKRGEDTLPAKRVCWACPVREECLEGALQRGEKFGVWGGLSERERRSVRRSRKRAGHQLANMPRVPSGPRAT